jgi:hypothetical protein
MTANLVPAVGDGPFTIYPLGDGTFKRFYGRSVANAGPARALLDRA